MMQTGGYSLRKSSPRPSWWSSLLLLAGIALIMTPAILLAASGGGHGEGFDAIVNSIEMRYHARATRIPFVGLISGIARISTHGGVHGLHVAEFEHFRTDGDKHDFDGAEFNELVEKHVGPGWQRLLRETSRERNGERGEQTLIYVRPDGKSIAMLVLDLDGNGLDVVQLSVNPDHLMDQMNEHRHHHHEEPEAGQQDSDEKEPTHGESE